MTHFSLLTINPYLSFFSKKESQGNIPPTTPKVKVSLGGNGGPRIPKNGWFERFMKKLIKTSQYFLPTRKEYREAFVGDMFELYDKMRQEGYNKLMLFLAVVANIASFWWKSMNGKEGSQIDDRND